MLKQEALRPPQGMSHWIMNQQASKRSLLTWCMRPFVEIREPDTGERRCFVLDTSGKL